MVGEITLESRAHPFFFFSSSSHSCPQSRPRFAGIFQDLSFVTAEPATPKMEAPCAAIKHEPAELPSLKLHSLIQDGCLDSDTLFATLNMASLSLCSGCAACYKK